MAAATGVMTKTLLDDVFLDDAFLHDERRDFPGLVLRFTALVISQSPNQDNVLMRANVGDRFTMPNSVM
jgi:hypothetical protein